MAKKKPSPRRKRPAPKPKPNFPPRFSTEGVRIVGVSYMPIWDDGDGPFVNHIDGNKSNNSAGNLE